MISSTEQLNPFTKLALGGLFLTPADRGFIIDAQLNELACAEEQKELVRKVLELKIKQQEFQLLLENEDIKRKKELYEQWEETQKAHQAAAATTQLLATPITSTMTLASLILIFQQLFLEMHTNVVNALRNDERLKNIRGYQINIPPQLAVTPPEPINKLIERNPEVLKEIQTHEDALALIDAQMLSEQDKYITQIESGIASTIPDSTEKPKVLEDVRDIVKETVIEHQIPLYKNMFLVNYNALRLEAIRSAWALEAVDRIYRVLSEQELDARQTAFQNRYPKNSVEEIQKTVESGLDNEGKFIKEENSAPKPYNMTLKR
jgi:hypothetical protein